MCREPPRAQLALCLRKGGHGIQKPCPWSICHLPHLSELGHAGKNPALELKEGGLPSLQPPRPVVSSCPCVLCLCVFLTVCLFFVALSTGCPHTYPSAQKPTGRTKGAMEALGGVGCWGSPGWVGLHGGHRGECLPNGKAGHPEHETVPWACVPAQLCLPLPGVVAKAHAFHRFSGDSTDLCSVSAACLQLPPPQDSRFSP